MDKVSPIFPTDRFFEFSVDTRQLRSAFRIAPASVLSISDVLRLERLPRAKTLEKKLVSVPLPLKLEEDAMLKPKSSLFKNHI